MSHANARLNMNGRLLLIIRVRGQGWAAPHAAKAMGISQQRAHRWLTRFDDDGEARPSGQIPSTWRPWVPQPGQVRIAAKLGSSQPRASTRSMPMHDRRRRTHQDTRS